ncbi:divalent-cation tolerance protein CutA [Candidatus Chlamydia sanziniae]|uniref:Periplasmic divalent cation tolerance protein CutA n=1 Tax=Candidatus Chlamydia sanziniae TaxID=1806891 RepID=A0A1A9HXQ8_9CHLA|nr:divalent-cation tolerance protein CutA [Candidatus Chlamydia sanziniae]ANH78706.1 Periplasmic divalent cation tolerance protein CutA [Candidatus Chlamydia sanziniae]
MKPVLILTQLPSQEQALALATTLITSHLAACVHIFPKGQSVYLWEGELQISEEYHVQIKTTQRSFPGVSSAIKLHCEYEVPEILLFFLEDGDKDYLHWLCKQSNAGE